MSYLGILSFLRESQVNNLKLLYFSPHLQEIRALRACDFAWFSIAALWISNQCSLLLLLVLVLGCFAFFLLSLDWKMDLKWREKKTFYFWHHDFAKKGFYLKSSKEKIMIYNKNQVPNYIKLVTSRKLNVKIYSKKVKVSLIRNQRSHFAIKMSR